MANLTRWDPFSELNSLVQKQFFGDDMMSSLKGINIPTTDVYVNDNQLVVEVHLPNFEQKHIDIHVDDNALIINAEKREKEEDKKKRYVVRESSSSFYRRINLPERAVADEINANLNDGVLNVTVPLKPLPEPKKIEVNSKKK